MKNETTHKATAPILQVNENVVLILGLFTRLNAALLTGALGVAILQNVLAGRDPQLAILCALVVTTFVLMGGGRFWLDAWLESGYWQTTSHP